MRDPDFDIDGWSLVNSEETHREAPDTFWIPPLSERKSLKVGDFVKLVFEISVDDDEEPVAVERMWVIVRKILDGAYIGILDNEPYAIAENSEFYCGSEIPFRTEHVIDIQEGDEKSISLAISEPLTKWPI